MLIILSKSLIGENYNSVLNLAAKLAEKGDKIAVLHIQDACLGATSSEYCARFLESKIDAYALKADIEARGLTEKLCFNVKTIDYRQWVSLLIDEHDKTVSWTS